MALAGLVLLALWPPVRGAMIVVPLSGQAADAVLALEGGARLLGEGPLPGSLVVTGNRVKLAAALKGRALLLAAPAMLCGAAARRGKA
ncbi:MAG: hypothetical protein J7495_18850 [Sphingomonas sp.]|nr:hypothetical protein [Sphingomonas sp.]